MSKRMTRVLSLILTLVMFVSVSTPAFAFGGGDLGSGWDRDIGEDEIRDFVPEEEIVEEEEPLDFFQTDGADGRQVTVEAPMGALPTLAELRAEMVEIEDVREAVESVVEGEANILLAMDISFWMNGIEIEPEEPVRVKISAPELDGKNNLTLVHIPDAEEPETVQLIDEEDLSFALGTNEIAFQADSFSVYAIVDSEDQSDEETYSVRFEFYFGEENGEPVPFVFNNENGDPTDHSFVTSGEKMTNPGLPPYDPENVEESLKAFMGWCAEGTLVAYDFDKTLEENLKAFAAAGYTMENFDGEKLTGNFTIKLMGTYEDAIYVYYYGQTGAKEGQYDIFAVRMFAKDGGSETVPEDDYVPDKSTEAFLGWSYLTPAQQNEYVDANKDFNRRLFAITREGNVFGEKKTSLTAADDVPHTGAGYTNGVAEDGMIKLYPVIAEVYWVTFDKNDWIYTYDTKDGAFNVVPGSEVEVEGGAYLMIELAEADKYGNTYFYEYVGAGKGTHNLKFEYIGTQQGAYSRASAGSSYTPATYVLGMETLEDSDYAGLPANPTRTGYSFDGWYLNEECTGEAFKATDIVSDKTYEQTGDLEARVLTLYAKWTPAKAAWTIAVWKQSLNDNWWDSDLQKTYDFAGSVTISAEQSDKTTGDYITIDDVPNTYKSYGWNSTDVTIGGGSAQSFRGFKYNAANTSSQQSTTEGRAVEVLADGTTVYNVYYDRYEYTINFSSNSSFEINTFTGTVDGETVELHPDGKGGYTYTKTVTETETQPYTGTRYSVSNNDNDNDPQKYGWYNGSMVSIYYRTRYNTGIGTRRWYRGQNGGNTYEGTRYIIDNNGTIGVIDGRIVTLNPDGTYSYTIERSWEEPYTGDVTEGTASVTSASYVGLYEQTFDHYGYRWPTEYVWNPGGGNALQTLMTAFTLPSNGYTRDDNAGTITYSLSSTSPGANHVHHYVEGLDGKFTEKDDIVMSSNAGAFTLTNKYVGFTVKWYSNTPSDSHAGASEGNLNQSIGNNYPYYIYHQRNTYTLTLQDTKSNAHQDFSEKYEASLSAYAEKTPEASYDGYEFSGWFADESGSTYVFFSKPTAEQVKAEAAVAEDKEEMHRLNVLSQTDYDNLPDTKKAEVFVSGGKYYQLKYVTYNEMPPNNLKLYAGYRIMKYRVWIQANGGQMVPGNHATYFNNTYDQLIGEYHPVYRNYIPATQLTDPELTRFAYVEIFGVSAARIALYVFEEGGKYYYYPNNANGRTSPGSDSQKVELTADMLAAAQSQGMLDADDFKYVYKYEAYTLVGWYQVDKEVTRDNPPAVISSDPLTPWNFGVGVREHMALRALWKRNGYLTVHYNTTVTLTNANGEEVEVELDDMQDIIDRDYGTYTDNAQGVADHAPTLKAAEGIDPSQWVFVGWQTPETDAENIYEPGNVFTIHADWAEEDPADEYHFIYNLTAVFRQIGPASVTYHPNTGTFKGTTFDYGSQWTEDGYTNTANTAETVIGNVTTYTAYDLVDFSSIVLSEGTDLILAGYYLAGWSDTQNAPGTAKEELQGTFYELGGTYGVSAQNTNGTVTVEDEELATNVLYAVWLNMEFYVYHSSDQSVYTVETGDAGYNEDGTYNLLSLVPAGVLYGGYYKDYAKKGSYKGDGIAVTDGENYTGDPSVWVSSEAFTATVADGEGGVANKMQPKNGATYYLKEVPTTYLMPTQIETFNIVSYEMRHLILTTAVDDTNYKETGFAVDGKNTKGAAAEKMQISFGKNSGDLSNTTVDLDVKKITSSAVEKGLVSFACVFNYATQGYDEIIVEGKTNTLSLKPYWITPDGVTVTGSGMRRIMIVDKNSNSIIEVGMADTSLAEVTYRNFKSAITAKVAA